MPRSHLALLLLLPLYSQAAALDCQNGRHPPASPQAQVCADPQLARLDRQLAWVYRRAAGQTDYEDSAALRKQQGNWQQQHNLCSDHDCLRDSYLRRIAGLQARFALIASEPPVAYRCDDPQRSTLFLRFFRTLPPSLILTRRDDAYLLLASVTAQGLQYQGDEHQVREGRDGLLMQWPGLTREASCVQQTDMEVPE